MPDETPIMNRLLTAIADSEADHAGSENYLVALTRKDAMDAAKRIGELLVKLSQVTTELYKYDQNSFVFDEPIS